MNHVHFIGIGGSGLSAIALVLLERGVKVSGSDRQLSPLAHSVAAAGAQVFSGHRPENVAGADLVVRSSAIPDANVEVQAARAAGVPVLKRSDFLASLMAGSYVIAVAGSHGKTTTTAMIAWMLAALGHDPSYIIGGVSANLGSNAHAGRGPHFVIEADEYDRMFLGLRPNLAIVTNVEHDHPDCYPTPQEYHAAFLGFAHRLSPGGALLVCRDDPGAAGLLAEIDLPAGQRLSYGLDAAVDAAPDGAAPAAGAHYAAVGIAPNSQGGLSFGFLAVGPAGDPLPVSLQVPGRHNVRNALAALAAAAWLGLPLQAAAAALGEFRGAGRRFELRGEARGVTVIDDYAHHPTEIRATLAAARGRYPARRIWAVWQPHTYSRTRQLFAEFAAAFDDAAQVVVTEVYASREAAPADGFSARQVVAAIQAGANAAGRPAAHFAPDLPAARDLLLAHLQPGDVLLVLSAGDADWLSGQVLEALQ